MGEVSNLVHILGKSHDDDDDDDDDDDLADDKMPSNGA